jgi:hypothetical protein
MGLCWRGAAATLLVVAAAALTLSVVNGWDWPLIGDARAGAIGVLVLGFAASVTGGGPQWFIAALRRQVSTQGRWLSIFASAMGLVTFALLVVDLFVNSIPLLVWTTVALVVMWVVATIHHAIEARPHISLLGGQPTA